MISIYLNNIFDFNFISFSLSVFLMMESKDLTKISFTLLFLSLQNISKINILIIRFMIIIFERLIYDKFL